MKRLVFGFMVMVLLLSAGAVLAEEQDILGAQRATIEKVEPEKKTLDIIASTGDDWRKFQFKRSEGGLDIDALSKQSGDSKFTRFSAKHQIDRFKLGLINEITEEDGNKENKFIGSIDYAINAKWKLALLVPLNGGSLGASPEYEGRDFGISVDFAPDKKAVINAYTTALPNIKLSASLDTNNDEATYTVSARGGEYNPFFQFVNLAGSSEHSTVIGVKFHLDH